MKNKLKAAAAAVTAFALLGGALPVNFAGVELLQPAVTAKAAGCCTFDEETGTLTLHGNVDKAEVYDFLSDFTEYWRWHYREYPWDGVSVKCEEGTVFPEDCSQLFASTSALYDYTAPPTDGDTSPTPTYDPDDIWYNSPIIDFDLRNADTSHVTNMQDMFQGCSVCKSMILDFDTSNVTNMSYMFSDCLYVTSLDLSSFDMTNVANAECMFYRCEKLKTIYAGRGWNVNPEETNCTKMFYNCPELVGGKGTEYSSDHVNGEYAHIDGGAENPGYLTFGGSTVKGASLSLDGRIGLNFYVRLNSDAAKAVLEGPLGTVEIPSSKFAGLTVQNGDYAGCTKLTYGINATQRLNKVTLKLYDSGNNLTDIYKGNAVPLTDKQFLYSAVDYIDSYQDTGNENLTNLVTALERYFKSAENHFMGKTHTIFPEGYSHRWFDDYNTADGDYGLSLILNSGTDLRIYTDAAEVIWQTDFDEYETLTAETSADGKRYFAITDIPAQNLVGSERIYVDGREHLVCPRDWCVLAVADDKPQTVQDLGWALYEYGKAAETYLHSL